MADTEQLPTEKKEIYLEDNQKSRSSNSQVHPTNQDDIVDKKPHRELPTNQGVDISFQNLKYEVQIKQKNKDTGKNEFTQKTVLNNINGICKQGELTAIMGASGAGKTSLLNVLCKRIQKNKTNNLEGHIKANDLEYRYDEFSQFASYIMQDDRLMETLTVKESLMFAARLKVKGTPQQQEEKVDRIIRKLKLDKCKDTLIGGKFLKGVSGGERKRTSVAFEMVTDPKVLFLDEPTSGLDSFTAFLVINLLKQMARDENKTIVITIHQPSSDIWKLFDNFMLLVQGKFIYQGPGGDSVVNHFKNIGFPCPETSNPSDYLMSICHKESQTNVDNYQKYYDSYDQYLAQPVKQRLEQKSNEIIEKRDFMFSFVKECIELYKRTLKTMMRNPLLFKARVGQTIFISLFVSAIYYQLEDGKDSPNDVRALNNFTGFFFFQSVNMMMLSIMPMVLTFPNERAVFLKEENGKLYGVTSYFIGRTLLEVPLLFLFPLVQSTIQFFMVGLRQEEDVYFKYLFINILISFVGNSLGLLLGSAFSDPKVASSMMPVVIMPFMLFAGFFANRDDLWPGVAWIEYLSPFKYGFSAHIYNQFDVTYFRPEPIQSLNLDIDFWEGCGALIAMFIGYRLIAFTFLYIFKQRLQ